MSLSHSWYFMGEITGKGWLNQLFRLKWKVQRSHIAACSKLGKLGQFHNILVGCKLCSCCAEGELGNRDAFLLGDDENPLLASKNYSDWWDMWPAPDILFCLAPLVHFCRQVPWCSHKKTVVFNCQFGAVPSSKGKSDCSIFLLRRCCYLVEWQDFFLY